MTSGDILLTSLHTAESYVLVIADQNGEEETALYVLSRVERMNNTRVEG